MLHLYKEKIIGLKDLEYEQRLVTLNLLSLGYRRARGDLIETFKITHGYCDPRSVTSLFNNL